MKKFLLPVLIVTLAFVSAGCTFKKSAEKSAPAPVVSQEGSGYVDSRSDVVSIESTESGALSQEMTNSGITSATDVAGIAAVNLGDKKRCEALPKAEKQECFDTINFDDAVFQSDYAKCGLIVSATVKATCAKEVSEWLSKNAGSLAACGEIKDASIKSACEARIRAFTNPTSAKSCEALAVPSDKLQCFDQLILSDVRTGKLTDAATCQKVVNPVLKKECEAWMKRNSANGTTGLDSGKEGTCTGRTGSSLQYCMKDLAVAAVAKTGSSSACSSITDAAVRTACVKDAENALARMIFDEAQTKNDPSLCSKIADATLQSKCKAIVSQ